MKHCKKCGQTKPTTEFYVKREWQMAPRPSNSCIPCMQDYSRNYQRKRQEKLKAMRCA
jgi:hypothetical protein